MVATALRIGSDALLANPLRTLLSTLGVIIGNRDFFPDVLVGEARKDLLKLFEQHNIKAIALTPDEARAGG